MVCWARARLVAQAHPQNPAGGTRPVGKKVIITENKGELVKLVLCVDKIKDIAVLVEEFQGITAAHTLSKGRQSDMAPPT